MKRIFSIVSALAITAGIVSAMPASGAYEDSYKPSFYITAKESETAQVLKFGSVYIDASQTEGMTSIDAEVFISDEKKLAGQIFVKWHCTSEGVKLAGLTDPVTVYGASPYSDFDTAEAIKLTALEEINMLGVNYSTFSPDPMELTGESSDAYPLACFTAELSEDIIAGSYDIDFLDEIDKHTSILYRLPGTEGKPYHEFFPAEYSEGLRINVSDRELGDVNKDGYVDAVDASNVLTAYANLSSGKDSGLTGAAAAAADVNGDKMIDAVDASNILAYYASISNGGEPGINKFIKGSI